MLAKDIISETFKNVSITNTVDEALEWMKTYKIKHLPIVKSKAFLSVISDEILRRADPGTPVGELRNDGIKAYVSQDDHVLEVAKIMGNEKLTLIPVLDENDTYRGVIKLEDLFEKLVTQYGLDSEGSILVLEMAQQDFHLSELIRILELEHIHLFSVLVSTKDFPNIEITLKTDIKDINPIVQTLERYSYKIKAYFEDDQYHNQLRDRYDSLISYLNI